jgi:hypothetical protein
MTVEELSVLLMQVVRMGNPTSQVEILFPGDAEGFPIAKVVQDDLEGAPVFLVADFGK